MKRKTSRQGGLSKSPKQSLPLSYRRASDSLRDDFSIGARPFKYSTSYVGPQVRSPQLTRRFYGPVRGHRGVSGYNVHRTDNRGPFRDLVKELYSVTEKVDFAKPLLDVVKCAKRKIRKEVLFALKVAGRSGGSPGPYRRNRDDEVKC